MLTRIYPWELDPITIELYYKAVSTDDHCGGVEEVSIAIGNESRQLWVWGTDVSTMVMVTEVRQHPDTFKEMIVLMLAGHGGLAEYNQVTDAFADRCWEFDCERVVAYVKPDLWKIFKAGGADSKEIYVVISKDAT
jgi:hypothetical protein